MNMRSEIRACSLQGDFISLQSWGIGFKSMTHKMQVKYFIWYLPEELIVFPKRARKMGYLRLCERQLVLYFMKNFRDFSRMVLTVCNCGFKFDLGL